MIIPAGGTHQIASRERYLDILSANRPFSISSKSQGLDRTTVKPGYSYDLGDIDIIDIHNDGQSDLIVELETSDLKTINGSSAGVEVVNAVTVNEIVHPVEAHTKAVNPVSVTTPPDVTIAKGQGKKLVGANPARYELVIQNISAIRGEARVGDANVSSNRGLVVVGSRKVPGSTTLTHGGEVWAFNNSDADVTLSLMEVLQ